MNLSSPFRRVVVTGVECSGKTTLSTKLAEQLGWAWVPEAARTHPDVRSGAVTEGTFDELHDMQTQMAADARDTHSGVICDTGDLVLRLWAETTMDFSWHPLLPQNLESTSTSCAPVSKIGKKTPCAPCPSWKTASRWRRNTEHT